MAKPKENANPAAKALADLRWSKIEEGDPEVSRIASEAGKARARKLSKKRRVEIARKASAAAAAKRTAEAAKRKKKSKS